MRIIITVLIFIFSLQSLSKADNIRDFEIEGMSVGDSLLDYFSKKEIIKEKKNEFNYADVFATTALYKKSYKLYDKVQMHYKLSDDSYKIYGLVGVLHFKENFNACLKKKDEIVSSFSDSFKSLKIANYDRRKHSADKSGNSFTHDTYFNFSDGSYLSVSCYDWSKEKNIENKWFDNLKVAIISKEFDDFLQEFYK